MKLKQIMALLCGMVLVGGSVWFPLLRENGFEVVGPIFGIILVILSLLGNLPKPISWVTKLGNFLYLGVVMATIVLLIPLIIPSGKHESSLIAFSPTVWAAYISIILVGISFETSTLPLKIYQSCKRSKLKPYILVPLYVIVAGFLGNLFDGVSIVIISTVIFMHLLSEKWTIRSIFALLFGGLISNLITVAAEPTNIKFQDVLGSVLNKLHPSFWVTNWPICILGVIFPAIFLGIIMKRDNTKWAEEEPRKISIFRKSIAEPLYIDTILASIAGSMLALGIIIHTIFVNTQLFENVPLWIYVFPAGVAALNHLFVGERLTEALEHIEEQLSVWIKLAVIFSLLWFLQNGLTGTKNVLNIFLLLPGTIQYIILVFVSLSSAIADNVALAATQGTIILSYPIAIWKIRLLLILLTWAGGLLPFASLQSLSVNHRLNLSVGQWIKETPLWAGLALFGGIVGLLIINFIYPLSVGIPK